MAESRFWCLNSPESTAKTAGWIDTEMAMESIVCPVYDGHQRAGKRLTDLSVSLPGGAVQDFVWTWYSECLIQDSVLEIFRANGVTGFEVKPDKAVFKRKTDREPPRLWELIVTGWAGIAPEESGIALIEKCQACKLLAYSGCTNSEKLIDASQWDGSDIFMVWPLPSYIFLTDRVARFIRDNLVTGAVLRRPADLHFSSGGFGPGRLSYSMPDDRARRLGEPLGIY